MKPKTGIKTGAKSGKWRVRARAKRIGNAMIGAITVVMLRILRFVDRKRTTDFAGWFMRKAGPRLPEQRVGRANLAAAFPEKSAEEIEAILAGVWDNLGRVGAEFAHLDRMTISGPEQPLAGDIEYSDVAVARIEEIIRSGRPRVFFAAHLANWELPALIAHHFKVDTAVLYRPPNIRAVGDAVLKIRAGCMGPLVPSSFDAPLRLARRLESGSHVGMLVDQHETRGVDVTFFGRTCKANPLLAILARQFDCPIQGIRIVRRPDGNSFWGEITEPLALPRDDEGRIETLGAMQAITSEIERWVREHPDQWLWLHRRWR